MACMPPCYPNTPIASPAFSVSQWGQFTDGPVYVFPWNDASLPLALQSDCTRKLSIIPNEMRFIKKNSPVSSHDRNMFVPTPLYPVAFFISLEIHQSHPLITASIMWKTAFTPEHGFTNCIPGNLPVFLRFVRAALYTG